MLLGFTSALGPKPACAEIIAGEVENYARKAKTKQCLPHYGEPEFEGET
jgi:hypothetical protein